MEPMEENPAVPDAEKKYIYIAQKNCPADIVVHPLQSIRKQLALYTECISYWE